MQHFPIFVDLAGRRVIVSGAGAAAVAKLRLLLKTNAHITVIGLDAAPEIHGWASAGKIRYIARSFEPGDALCAVLVYGANEQPDEDRRVASLARLEGALVNIVDNLNESQFITPAIVDRDPVTVAIGTEGAAPVLARAIKADLEARLPRSLGVLARAGKAFRKWAEGLPMGRARREFWYSYYFEKGPRALERDGDQALQSALRTMLAEHLHQPDRPGRVDFVGAGPGDPELLTLKARKLLDKADVVIHDRLVSSEILELARREAVIIEAGKTGFGPATAQSDINEMLVTHAHAGAHVVRLKGGDPSVFGRLDEEIAALHAEAITYNVVPGITAASAGAAILGQSLTRRGRNGALHIITAQDLAGYAEHDWAQLARPGSVSAIYMGKKAARFLQGRLLMHGGSANTVIRIVMNATLSNQRVFTSTLATLPKDMESVDDTGPALLLLGIEPLAHASTAIPSNQRNSQVENAL